MCAGAGCASLDACLPTPPSPPSPAALTLIGAAPAAADSIAYIKDGNVWLSTSDGGRQYQVTPNGGYTDVSQADDGTTIGLNGVRLHRLDRTGEVLALTALP